ncbi:MAG: hemolysin family protein [Patescibacteria group bacterium]|jgi:CBS domain containing-hemolysin-like protein
MTSTFLILILLIALSAFFSGAEVALLSTSNVKVQTFLAEHRRGAGALARLQKRPRRMLITILIGNNVANLSAASMATVIATERLGSTSLGLVTGMLTLVILVFGEITPKTISAQFSGRIALLVAQPVLLLEYALYPLVLIFGWFADLLKSLIHVRDHDAISEAEIRSMLQYGVENQVITPAEQAIMNRAVRFADTHVSTVMTKLNDVVALEASVAVEEAIPLILTSGHSRIPVYHQRKNLMTGVVLLKELVEVPQGDQRKPLSAFSHEPIIVQEEAGIDTLMRVFQKAKKHLALVRDARGRFVGLVTLEDLLEELVGEIVDETDRL